MIEKIEHNGVLLSIILRSNYDSNGIQFFTPPHFSQQLGFMKRKKNHIIKPHCHNVISREVTTTQEVLLIKSGKVRIDYYTSDQIYILSKILLKGDVVLLASGGHGFEMLEESQIIEIKQGPFLEENDKIRFKQVDKEKLVIH